MSTEPHDQHLSDAVDGQLPAEPLAVLQRDAELASRLQSLRQDAAAVRELGEQTRRDVQRSAAAGAQRPSIAASVLAEAIRRAEEQQLDSAHPLMLASESIGAAPVGPPDRRMSVTRWSAVAALAASVALWFTLAPPPTTPLALAPTDTTAATNEHPSDHTSGSAAEAAAAFGDPDRDALASIDPPMPSELGIPEIPDVEPSDVVGEASPGASPELMMASSSSVGSPRAELLPNSKVNPPLTQHLLIYDVRLTAMGRALRPVRSAMLAAGLGDGDRYRIDQSVVDVARSVTDPQETFRVMVLRAPLITLDRLFLALAADAQSVESIGLTLVNNAAVARLVQSVTEQVVAAGGVGVELTDQDDQPPARLAGWIGDRAFLPVGADAMVASSGSVAGNDVQDETVLVLIR